MAMRRWSLGRDILSMRDEIYRAMSELFEMTAGDGYNRTSGA
jgi:hypothetical protein